VHDVLGLLLGLLDLLPGLLLLHLQEGDPVREQLHVVLRLFARYPRTHELLGSAALLVVLLFAVSFLLVVLLLLVLLRGSVVLVMLLLRCVLQLVGRLLLFTESHTALFLPF
jgi:hypothetical protein